MSALLQPSIACIRAPVEDDELVLPAKRGVSAPPELLQLQEQQEAELQALPELPSFRSESVKPNKHGKNSKKHSKRHKSASSSSASDAFQKVRKYVLACLAKHWKRAVELGVDSAARSDIEQRVLKKVSADWTDFHERKPTADHRAFLHDRRVAKLHTLIKQYVKKRSRGVV